MGEKWENIINSDSNIDESNHSANDLDAFLSSINETDARNFYIRIYNQIKEYSIQERKTELDTLNNSINILKNRLKKIKNICRLNYSLVACITGFYFLDFFYNLPMKILGVFALLLIAYNNYYISKRDESTKVLLKVLLQLKQHIPNY